MTTSDPGGDSAVPANEGCGPARVATLGATALGEGKRRRPSGEPPPLPRSLDRWTLALTLIAGIYALIWLPVFASDSAREWLVVAEGEIVRGLAQQRSAGLLSIAQPAYGLLHAWAVVVIGWATLLVLAAYQRWRHLVAYVLALASVAMIAVALQWIVSRPRPYEVTHLGPWEGFAHPSVPVAAMAAAVTGAVFCLIPVGRRAAPAMLAGIGLILVALMELYLGLSHPSDIATALVIGVVVPSVLLRMIAPEEAFPVNYRRAKAAHLDLTGPRGRAIREAVESQLGLKVAEIKPVGLAGSAGSTPMRLTVVGPDSPEPKHLFAKLLAESHLSSDRFYKLGRTMLYGRLEDEWPYKSVRQLAQHEDYMSLRMAAAGIVVPRSYGLVEITPEREYLVVTDFLEGFVEIGEAELGESAIDGALEVIRKLWRAGLAHRDVKPANVMTRGDEVAFIDTGFGEVRPSPWRQAVDLANMMLLLALRTSPDLVYERALRLFSADEIAEAFAANHGVTVPTQLKSALKADGRDLDARFRALAPPRESIAIQRWSVRRVALLAGVAAAVVLFALFGIRFLGIAGLLP